MMYCLTLHMTSTPNKNHTVIYGNILHETTYHNAVHAYVHVLEPTMLRNLLWACLGLVPAAGPLVAGAESRRANLAGEAWAGSAGTFGGAAAAAVAVVIIIKLVVCR